jgi:phosphomevalonate kinase
MTMTGKETTVSAPGKVLIAGGYLVLEPAYPGLVISTTARFYTTIRPAASSSTDSDVFQVCVKSPQFTEAQWTFIVTLKGGKGMVEQTQESWNSPNAGPNPFISLSLLYSIRLALEVRSIEELTEVLQSKDLDVFVLADNDFYSTRENGKAASTSQLKAKPPFRSQDRPIREVHKTGLGSSAAMTTSLVGALLVHLEVVQPDDGTGKLDDASLALIHNTAQLAHCAAQGKVGSGFDVSAAVWGSHLYRRFDKAVLQSLLDAMKKVDVVGTGSLSSVEDEPELLSHLDPRNPLWQASPLSQAIPGETNPTAVEGLAAGNDEDMQTARPAPLELPPHIELVLADVDAGSNTPSMVGKILEWRRSKPEWAKQIWKILASANQTLADSLLALRLAHAQDSKEYLEAITLGSRSISKEWDALSKKQPSTTLTLLIELRNAMRSVQGGMRELGRQGGVPVEPNEMGNVIRATIDGAAGVVGGGVPGAGGYDALYILYLDPSDASSPSTVRNDIGAVWSKWDALSVGPLLSSAGGAVGVSSAALQAQSAMLAQGLPALPSSQIEGGFKVHIDNAVPGLNEAITRIL